MELLFSGAKLLELAAWNVHCRELVFPGTVRQKVMELVSKRHCERELKDV